MSKFINGESIIFLTYFLITHINTLSLLSSTIALSFMWLLRGYVAKYFPPFLKGYKMLICNTSNLLGIVWKKNIYGLKSLSIFPHSICTSYLVQELGTHHPTWANDVRSFIHKWKVLNQSSMKIIVFTLEGKPGIKGSNRCCSSLYESSVTSNMFIYWPLINTKKHMNCKFGSKFYYTLFYWPKSLNRFILKL